MTAVRGYFLAASAAVAAAVFLFPSVSVPDGLGFLKFSIAAPAAFSAMPGSLLSWSLAGPSFLFFLRLFSAFLCFDAGRRLAGVLPGTAAALVSLLIPADIEQLLFSSLLLIFSDLALWREEKGGRPGALAAGICLGSALLVRSSAFLICLAYPVFEFLSARGPRRDRVFSAALVAAGALLPLAAWNLMSVMAIGRPVLFELDRAWSNVVSGAMGGVMTIEGDFRALAGIGPADSPLGWAISQVAAEPARYLAAVGKRLWFFVSGHALLSAGAAAGLFLARRRSQAWLLALLAASFLAPHFLMSVEDRYFIPALFLLLPLAAAVGLAAGAVPRGNRVLDGVLVSAAFLSALFSVYLNAVVLRAAAGLRTPGQAVEEYLSSGTESPFLLKLAVERELKERRVDSARSLLLAAASGGGYFPSRFAEIMRTGGEVEISSDDEADLLLAIALLRTLETSGARGAGKKLERLESQIREKRCVARGSEIGEDLDIAAQMEEKVFPAQRRYAILRALEYWPDEEHRTLLASLSSLFPLDGALAVKYRLSSGGGPEAVLCGASRCRTAADSYAEILGALKNRDARAASSVYVRDRSLFTEDPGGGGMLLEAGLIGGSEELIEAGLKSDGRGLSYEKPLDPCSAMKILRSSGRKDVFIGISAKRAALGLQKESAAAARCGLSAATDPEERFFLAVALQDAGDPASAAEVLTGLAERDPGNARLLGSAGTARFLAGDRSGAEEMFARALAADPGDNAAAAGLAVLRSSSGRKKGR